MQRFIVLAVSVCVGLGACAPLPIEPVGETLDPQTGTTVWLLPKPVELVAEHSRARGGDPFAYVAPFQTNRMGEYALYLWVSAPQNEEGVPLDVPRVLCDGQPVELTTVEPDLEAFGLSRPPYELPAPWSGQWYFKLPSAALRCLAQADRVSIETRQPDAEPERFSAQGEALAGLARFTTRVTMADAT